MATRTAVVHDRCTTPGCGRTLHSLREAEAGRCSSCWMASLPKDTKTALNRLLASAFNGASVAEKTSAVDAAFVKLRRDEAAKQGGAA